MIRKRAELNTVNPPGQIVFPEWAATHVPTLQKSIEEWKKYEQSRNGICDKCETVAHCMKHGCIPERT